MRRMSPHAGAGGRSSCGFRAVSTDHHRLVPQTAEVRNARKRLHEGKLSPAEYDAFIAERSPGRSSCRKTLGLDVLVQGDSSATTG